MKKLLSTLIICSSFGFISPSYAEPACGSDTSSDPDIARGKDVWLNGYCDAFLPCKLVLAQFHACQAVETFLTNLNAQKDVPLTDSQVESALVKTNQNSSAGASPEKKPMSKNIALIERNRVSEMDDKAAALVQSNCGPYACDRLLESTVDPVIREVDSLNSNSEYLAQLPKYAPIAAVETAARLGWKKDGAFWVFSNAKGAAGSSANTSTLKDYLLSVPECQKLHDKLDQEIKASPSKEPFNLSFFEGECVPQLASFAEDIKNWRALLTANANVQKTNEQKTEVTSNNDTSTGHVAQIVGNEDQSISSLNQWAESLEFPARPLDKPWYSWWRKFKTADNCAFFLFGGTPQSGSGLIPDEDVDPAKNKFSVEWSGKCVDGYAEGAGQVKFRGEVMENGGSGSYMDTEVAVGTMRNGVFDGLVEWNPTEERDYPATIYTHGCTVSETDAYRNAELCKKNPTDKWYCQAAWRTKPTYRTEGCSAIR